jgi:hypothetical protein
MKMKKQHFETAHLKLTFKERMTQVEFYKDGLWSGDAVNSNKYEPYVKFFVPLEANTVYRENKIGVKDEIVRYRLKHDFGIEVDRYSVSMENE